MRFPIRNLTIACTVVLSARAQEYVDPKANDITNNGNYLIARCGKDIPNGKAEQLVSLLQEIGRDLPVIVTEANTGIESAYGFQSFFTSNDAIPTVTDVFGKLSDSERVSVNGQETQVRFVCLEKDDPPTASIYAQFMNNQPRAAAYSEFGSGDIYLAPLFFTELQRNPAPYRCLIFRRWRLGWFPAINGDDILGTTQYATLIHELIDKYVHFDGLGGHVERYNLKDCINLQAPQQLVNAENYSMFASGRLISKRLTEG